MKQITTAAGIIFNDKNEVLCTERAQGKYEYVSFKWEFPGGKLEAGETNEQALTRELREELDIEVEIQDFFYQVEHDYPDFHLSMGVYKCKLLSNQMKMNVHEALKWLPVSQLLSLDWAAADRPVAEKLVAECK